MKNDLLITNARIETMDPSQPEAQAALICGGKFVYVGSNARAKSLADGLERCEQLDAGGRLMIPGFNDAHMHFLHRALMDRTVDLSGANSLGELYARLQAGRNAYIERKQTGFLQGEGWNQDRFQDERRFPTCKELDGISADIPIIIYRACHHIAVLNSAGLKAMGISRENASLYGNLVGRDSEGELNGLVKESLLDRVTAQMELPDVEEMGRLLQKTQNRLLEKGITSIQSDDLCSARPEQHRALLKHIQALCASGKIRLRYSEQLYVPDLARELEALTWIPELGKPGDHFHVSAIKIIGDGSLGARTAHLRQGYRDDPGNHGIAFYDQPTLDEMVARAHERGVAVAIHAIGDGAVDSALTAIERARLKNPAPVRHGLVHCQITDRALLSRFAQAGALALTQPVFLDYDSHIVRERVGNDLAETSYAFHTYVKMGVCEAFGTDCPVEDFDPMPGLYCAVSRRDLKGEGPYLPDEAMGMQKAVACYTASGAYASGEEAFKGRIRAGMLADFVLMDRDILRLPVEECLQAQVDATYVGGERLYTRIQ